MRLEEFRLLQAGYRQGSINIDRLLYQTEILPRKINIGLDKSVPQKVRVYRFLKFLLVRMRILKNRYGSFKWTPKLKHISEYTGDGVVVVWAVGAYEKKALEARLLAIKETGFSEGVVPVLITNVADFAFYSRLGWLVEYVPELSGVIGSYAEKKLNYLAWRYRDAKVISCDLEN
jgi:hypothetical protein